MKKLLLFTGLLIMTGVVSAQSPAKYINAKDSTPPYANICAVLLKGKEFNRVCGSHCPVLAQYIFEVGWVAADRKPWTIPQISHRRWKKLDVSYWCSLPAQWPIETAKR